MSNCYDNRRDLFEYNVAGRHLWIRQNSWLTCECHWWQRRYSELRLIRPQAVKWWFFWKFVFRKEFILISGIFFKRKHLVVVKSRCSSSTVDSSRQNRTHTKQQWLSTHSQPPMATLLDCARRHSSFSILNQNKQTVFGEKVTFPSAELRAEFSWRKNGSNCQ